MIPCTYKTIDITFFLSKKDLPEMCNSLDYLSSENCKFYTGHETHHSVKFTKMAVTFEPMVQFLFPSVLKIS